MSTPALARTTAGPLAGTGTLTRLALRRDRLTIPLWALVTGGLVASGAGAVDLLFSPPGHRREACARREGQSGR
ncbi:ABC transporter permease, partial [Streptomyces sp. NPDC059556]